MQFRDTIQLTFHSSFNRVWKQDILHCAEHTAKAKQKQSLVSHLIDWFVVSSAAAALSQPVNYLFLCRRGGNGVTF